MKSVALSVVNCSSTTCMPLDCGGLLEHLGNALAVGGAVVDDRDLLQLQRVGGVEGQAGAQGVVVGDDAVGGLVAGLGQVGVGGRAGDVRDAAIVVDLGGGDGGAGVQVADHAGDLGVAQLLGDGRALLRVGGVVFGRDLELDLLAADHDVLGVQVLDGHAHAVLVVLAVVGLGTGHRGDVADLDDLHVLRAGHARHSGNGGGHRQFQLHLHKNLQSREKVEISF